MNELLAWIGLLIGSQTGIASVYFPSDGHCGAIRADGKPFSAGSWHLAHRRLKLGTKVLVFNPKTWRVAVVPVKDRGPYGFCSCKAKPMRRPSHGCAPGCKWRSFLPNRCRVGYYRGVVDLTRPVAHHLGIKGFTVVKVFWWNIGHPQRKGETCDNHVRLLY